MALFRSIIVSIEPSMCSSKKTVVSLFAFSGDVAVRAVAVMHVAVAKKSGLIAFVCFRPAS